MQKNNKIKDHPDQQDSPQKKNSKAKIKATDKYNKANYKNLSIRVKPAQAEKIRDTASRHNLSLAQLIVQAVTEYDTNHQHQQENQPQPQQEHADTDTQTAGEPDTTSSDTDTSRETETDFDWIDDLYMKNKQSEKE